MRIAGTRTQYRLGRKGRSVPSVSTCLRQSLLLFIELRGRGKRIPMTATITHPLTARGDAGRMEPTSVPGPRGPRDRPRATPVLGQVQVQNPRRIRRAPENRNGRILKTGGSVLVARVHLAYPREAGAMTEPGKPAGPLTRETRRSRNCELGLPRSRASWTRRTRLSRSRENSRRCWISPPRTTRRHHEPSLCENTARRH